VLVRRDLREVVEEAVALVGGYAPGEAGVQKRRVEVPGRRRSCAAAREIRAEDCSAKQRVGPGAVGGAGFSVATSQPVGLRASRQGRRW
jgi:hypothetical protein